MSLEEAQATLGVNPGADFESILRAKEVKTKKAAGDQDKLYEVRSHAAPPRRAGSAQHL